MRRLYRRIRTAPKKVTIPILIFIVALLAFGGYQGYRLYHYTKVNPEFCRTCHLMEDAWDRWETSEHKDINCHDCHEAGLIQGIKHLVENIFSGPQEVSAHALVSDEACSKCHHSGDPKWIQIAGTEGHRIHNDEQHVACVTCHGVTVHRFLPDNSTVCGQCHADRSMPTQEMGGEAHCLSCHEFLAGSTGAYLPTRATCLNCHQAYADRFEVTWPADAPMQYPCDDCHQPHQQVGAVVDCLSCHPMSNLTGLHGTGAHGTSSGTTNCEVCHQPHAWTVTERQTCLQCHPDRAGHYTGNFCGSCHSF